MTSDAEAGEGSRREHSQRRLHRTWPERATVIGTFLSALVCFIIAAALVIAYTVVRNRNIAEFENPAEAAAADVVTTEPTASPIGDTAAAPTATSTTTLAAAPGTGPGRSAGSVGTTEPDDVSPADSFPEADPDARNFLITGADNNACIDPDSPFAGAFGDRETMGERSDTIMIIRVDPSVDRAAVLSLPRDLWVEIADTGSKQRINAAYRRDEPQRLADTIYNNFGVPIDHFIQVDFCAFKELVDAVGGVAVPFEFPTRDTHTGLLIEAPGCAVLDGEQALAYVRSRYYEFEDPPGSGQWRSDPTSDLGRISRQQDFLRRVLSSVLDKGPLDTRLVRGLINVADRYIVTDRELTPAKMLEFAGVMKDVQPAAITTYQIEATPRTINGNAVLVPQIDGDNMQSVLALFQGELSLGDAPVQEFEETTTAAPRGSTTTVAPPIVGSTEPTGTGPATSEPAVTAAGTIADTAPDTTVPGPEENPIGIVPPRDVKC